MKPSNSTARWPARAAAATGAHAAVTADEAKALGTTLTADRRREGRQQGRHHSRLHRRPDHAAGRLQGRRRHPPGPVRGREAAPRRSTPRTWRQYAGQLTEGTKALLQKYPTLPRRRLPDAPHASRSRSSSPTTPPRPRPRPRRTTTAARSKARTPASRSRSRRPATRRCGTTWCASTARPTRPSTAT